MEVVLIWMHAVIYGADRYQVHKMRDDFLWLQDNS